MNRFFSKLDLRDIKIDPQGSHFPPDAEAFHEDDETDAADTSAPVTSVREFEEAPHVPAWTNSPPEEASYESGTVIAATEEPERFDGEVARFGEVLKVSARSRPSAVAGAIAGVVRESGRAEVQAIGAGATNQAVKAVAIARDYLRETGIEAVCLPAFIDVTIDNEDRTAIRLVVEPR
jgi:stage V sporulation protein S